MSGMERYPQPGPTFDGIPVRDWLRMQSAPKMLYCSECETVCDTKHCPKCSNETVYLGTIGIPDPFIACQLPETVLG